METIKTLLIADRGEIAVRIIKTAKELGIRTIAVHTAPDTASLHVSQADRAVLLSGPDGTAYTDGDEIIKIAREHGANAVIPGYGRLSENADFARAVRRAGMAWVGPSPESIEAFASKHTACERAAKAGLPVRPVPKGLIESDESPTASSETLGPSASHRIEVQIFGNGQGDAIHFGERECSIQRRHQPIIGECPSPFVKQHAGLRERLTTSAVRLAESQKYGGPGTVEYLVDDTTGDFSFTGMTTRLSAGHGPTELCYDVDLVELMLKQAGAELAGRGGLSSEELKDLQPGAAYGHVIEARVYADDPLRDDGPSSGLLEEVEWEELGGSRIDTWVSTGAMVSASYDPLLATIMNHAKTREAAIKGMDLLLTRTTIRGPPTNLALLASIVRDEAFRSGDTVIGFVEKFRFAQ